MTEQPLRGKERLSLLDALRGFALLNMVLYHILYDVVYIFGHPIGWYQSAAGYVWEQFICWSFILLSGFCFSLGSRPIKRGLLVFGAGCVISLVTMFVMPEQRVRFGILSLIGCCMLLTRLCLPLMKRILPEIGILFCFALFCFTKALPFGGFGWGDTVLISLPDWLYSAQWLYPIGLPNSDFFSSDYFPLFPWLFLYWTGWFAFYMWRNVRNCKVLKIKIPVLDWLGRYSLWIYIIHQPIVYGILWGIHAVGLL